ncbi:MAG: MBL fold metallo-hydrolase [Candidatus Wildermuthbacteria bacterium]|nr:MBL fold metallo-hydrolase [Candidatus Wildermuthbacteria bacterium]
MKISKYLHSCLLVGENGKTALVDPGIYTQEQKALKVKSLKDLDYVLYTHSHYDHFHPPMLQEILKKFPEVQVITTQDIAGQIQKAGIQADVQIVGNGEIELMAAAHEPIFGMEVENTGFHIFGKLTHPGDSLHFNATKAVLALPITAPWGTMVAALEKASQLKPKVVIPIHDWHWREDAQQAFYGMATQYFEKQGIQFKGLKLGEVFEI